MFHRPGSQPSLHAKAAETRHLVPALAEILEEVKIVGDPTEHMHASLAGLTAFYAEIAVDDLYFDDAKAVRVQQGLFACLRHYSYLSRWAKGRGVHRWGEIPKMHYAAHLALVAACTNPRLS